MKKENKKENKAVETIIECALPLSVLGGGAMAFGSYFTIGSTSLSSIGTVVATLTSIPMLCTGGVLTACGYGVYSILTKDNKILKEERQKWFNFWDSIGIHTGKDEDKTYPVLFEIEKTSYGCLYKFIPNLGLSSTMINNKDVSIKEYLNARDIKAFIKDNILFIQSFTVDLPNFVPFRISEVKSNDLVLELGKDTMGGIITLNLDKSPSLLIGGQTGSGKSVCTNTILVQILCKYKDVDVYLIDVKRTEFGIYKKCKGVVKYTKDLNEAKEMIKELVEECDRRSDLFDEVGARKLQDYNKRVGKDKQLKKIVLAIDDSVRLMSDNDTKKALAELGFICRSAGVSIISNIQRPTAKLFSADFKASLTNIIGFKTINRINSEVICGDGKLKDLRGRGHGILFSESCLDGESEFQGFALEDYQIENYLKEYNCY